MKLTTLIRWLLALACLIFCIRQFQAGLQTAGLGAAGFLILGFGSMLAVVLLIAPETIVRICEFFSRIFTSIILPDDRSHKPPLSYILARRYRQQLRYSEAVKEYRKIIHYYPDEQTPYVELISLAHQLRDERLATKYIHLLKRRFPKSISLGEESSLPEKM